MELIPLTERELLAIPMGDAMSPTEIYSGVARHAGTLWCVRHSAVSGRQSQTCIVVMHPASNFLGHYLLPALARSGCDAVGMTTRYLGNDSTLILENCVIDVGTVVRFLRNVGYERVVLFGNSGGGPLAALYQSQAESPTITQPPGGGGPDLTRADLPSADALILAMAHVGRANLLTEWLDPSLRSEFDAFDRDPALDMFNADHGPPYAEEFVGRYRLAQRERNQRITTWAEGSLERLAGVGITDVPFVVHAVCADPRFLDVDLDESDREAGTLWGDPWQANFQPAALGHYTTLRSWLSQWSLSRSNGDGALALKTVSVPVHVIYGTADQGAFPSHARALHEAARHPGKALTAIKGGKHYLSEQPELIDEMVSTLSSWLATVL